MPPRPREWAYFAKGTNPVINQAYEKYERRQDKTCFWIRWGIDSCDELIRTMPIAKLISTKGPYLEALLEIAGQVVCVCDEFSLDATTAPKPGDKFEFQFSNVVDGNESWEAIFAANPHNRLGIDQIDGWTYQAFGKVISVNPVKVDCGLFVQEDVLHTHDMRVVDEFIGFKVSRLGGYAN